MNTAPGTDERRIRHALLFLAAALTAGPVILIAALLLLPPTGALLLAAALYGATHLVSRWRWQIGIIALAALAYYLYRNGDRP